MGAGQSVPSGGDSAKHVFSAAAPINYSPELLDSLQSSAETNSTRAKTLDLHIAQRAAAKAPSLLELSSVSPKDLIASVGLGQQSDDDHKAATTQKVQAEIDRLKKELGQRKVLKELPKDVDKARNDVVACLRLNDRRPLDCWKEVEAFKREVKKLEDEFVSRLL
ncbi:hypothetical protein DV735_g2009, partial [Chaetothyriales sp. CBS 134920]